MGVLDNILGINQQDSATPEVASVDIANVWSDPTAHPEPNVIVLCEIGSLLPVVERSYCRGQFDQNTGVFFTSEGGPYQILDISRWMQVK